MNNIAAISCNECGRVTRHTVKADYQNEGSEPHHDLDWKEDHAILECGGCGSIVFRTALWFSHKPRSDDGPTNETYYPPRLDRPMPVWFGELPDDIQDILDETYTAYYHDQQYLAAVGIRTTLDLALVNKIGDAGTFSDKVDILRMNGLIAETDTHLLLTALEAGNAAAHRGFRPSKSDLGVMLNILEGVLYALFLRDDHNSALHSAAADVRKRVPPRPSRQRRSGESNSE